ncbi:MAG: YraN family protein [Patescibacteria group bacterium]
MSWENSSKLVGDKGEKIACEYLVEKGYKILAKNYSISFGEIDIIAKKKWRFKNLFIRNHSINSGQVIHFIEVKTIIDADSSFFPEERVDFNKQKKLRQMAEIWLEKNKFSQNQPYQIDVVGIQINQDIKKVKINYFENVVEDK